MNGKRERERESSWSEMRSHPYHPGNSHPSEPCTTDKVKAGLYTLFDTYRTTDRPLTPFHASQSRRRLAAAILGLRCLERSK